MRNLEGLLDQLKTQLEGRSDLQGENDPSFQVFVMVHEGLTDRGVAPEAAREAAAKFNVDMPPEAIEVFLDHKAFDLLLDRLAELYDALDEQYGQDAARQRLVNEVEAAEFTAE